MKKNALFAIPTVLALAWGVAVPSSLDAAEDKKKKTKVYATLEEAAEDPDFALQGEYAGEIAGGGGETLVVGAQVIALGDGTFRAVGYSGGLPGAGWDGEEVQTVNGTRDGDKVVFSTPEDADVRGVLKKGVITVGTVDGVVLGSLKKVERKSPTLGAKPPEGAIVLFDGSSADAFKGGKMTADGLLKQGATSKQAFGDHRIHIEFLLPYRPKARGQGRGNSGLYVANKHEIQMLDSFGLSGNANECGGIYSYVKPSVNMCFPPLAWQTFDIDYREAKYDDQGQVAANARMTVKHNGVVIHDNVELKPHKKKGPGPMLLQNHGNPVRYRNIWVVE